MEILTRRYVCSEWKEGDGIERNADLGKGSGDWKGRGLLRLRLKVQTYRERRLPYDVDTTELLLEPGNINRSHCRYPPLRPLSLPPSLPLLSSSRVLSFAPQRSSTAVSQLSQLPASLAATTSLLDLFSLLLPLPTPPSLAPSQDPFPCTTSSRETATNEAKNIGSPELRPSQKRYARDLEDGNGADFTLERR